MSDTAKKGVGVFLTGGLAVAAGLALILTGTVSPLIGVVGTIIVAVAGIFGIKVYPPSGL